jgi:hypothetical protein
MPEVITAIEQITPDWLTDVLRKAGTLERGSVTALETQASERSTAITVRITVTYTDDAPVTAPVNLFLKLGGRANEVYFHQQIAPEMPDAPIIRCYDAVYDEAHHQQHLLFDDASKTHAAPPELISPTQAECQRMLDVLARFHAFWWEHPRFSGDIGQVNAQSDNNGFVTRRTREAFPGFVDFMGDRLSPVRRALYEKMLECWPLPSLLERINRRQMVTLNHGDGHAQNYLLPHGEGRVYLIDWADWRINPGPCDVAFLIGLEFYPERRARMDQALVRYYHERLLKYGVVGYDWAQCWLDYRVGIIANLLMPVFWYSWSPPQFWWHTLEKALLAFQDLRCEELLS